MNESLAAALVERLLQLSDEEYDALWERVFTMKACESELEKVGKC